ncbi:MAG TPA: HAD family phosphatase [Candidatus Limnocylindria bacterium]|nr:HAD family phosphatase [Candidatus Limnocylindria bacterium]
MTSRSPADRPGGAEPTLSLPGRFRAAIFDLDGLLLDTEPGWQRAETELLRRHGDTYTEADAAASLGSPVWEVVDRYAARLGLDGDGRDRLLGELLELARAEYAGRLELLPGAIALLDSLQGRLPMAVASNTPRELVVQALAASGLARYFDVVVTAEEVPNPKPAPDIYIAACRELAVTPSEAVALEDSALGISAARQAGLTVIAVPQSSAVDTSAAYHVIGSLSELVVKEPPSGEPSQ